MCFLAFPTIQSVWCYHRSALSEQVLRQQGTLAWGCYVKAMVSATDPQGHAWLIIDSPV